jgi:hypothetical protein
MKQFRLCMSCNNKYDMNEFATADAIWCKSCSLIGKRMLEKFKEMIEAPVTELAELEVFLDEWYMMPNVSGGVQ